MKTPKIKRYRLGVSRYFPKTHPRKGEPTYFVEKIYQGLGLLMPCKPHCYSETICNGKHCLIDSMNLNDKIHTIRANYPLWEKRMKEVQAGMAVIELFYWSGKPYNSPQVVFATLEKNSGCGVQKLNWREMIQVGSERAMVQNEKIYTPLIEYTSAAPTIETISLNDGLSLEDFKAWFKGYDLSKPMAIIHFSGFRY